MSLLLGIDAATVAVSAAIVRDGVVIGAFTSEGARRQTEILHPALELLLSSTGVAPGDLDGVVVDVGPGRFTGVRVGVAAAKGIAFGAGIPTIGLSSPEILLARARAEEVPVIAVVDLRRGEVAVLMSGDEPSAILRTTPVGLGHLIAERDLCSALLIGDGAIEYEVAIAAAAGAALTVAGRDRMAPQAVDTCLAVERHGLSGAVDPAALTALYLRGADVQLGWATRDGDTRLERSEVG